MFNHVWIVWHHIAVLRCDSSPCLASSSSNIAAANRASLSLRPTAGRYGEEGDNHLALVAQIHIFFSLLSSIALSFNDNENSDHQSMDVLLTILLCIPFTIGLLLEFPGCQMVFYDTERNKLGNLLNKKSAATTCTV